MVRASSRFDAGEPAISAMDLSSALKLQEFAQILLFLAIIAFFFPSVPVDHQGLSALALVVIYIVFGSICPEDLQLDTLGADSFLALLAFLVLFVYKSLIPVVGADEHVIGPHILISDL